MGRIFGVGAVAVLLVVVGLLFRTLNAAGYFKTVTSSYGGKCIAIEGAVGAEDMDLDRATGELFISSQDRRPFPLPPGQQLKPGDLYVARLAGADVRPRSLIGATGMRLHPHGVSLYRDGGGKRTLAVVNHPEAESSEILLFDVVEQPGVGPQLTLRRRVQDPLIHDANDVTLMSHEAFYVTNDHGSESAFGRMLEDYLLLPRADVVYYDGSQAQVVASGLNYANGINHSPDFAMIYVAETTGRAIQVYRRNETGALVHLRSLYLSAGPDNIDVDAQGNLWVAAHPKMLDFIGHAQDAKKLSPSAIFKIDPRSDDGEDGLVQTIYVNVGDEISGSSVAVSDGKRLVIGPVFARHYLNCG